MQRKGARCSTGHFFKHVCLFAAGLLSFSGCSPGKPPLPGAEWEFVQPDVVMVICFTGTSSDDINYSDFSMLNHSAAGELHDIRRYNGDPLTSIASRADSSGFLLLAVVPEDFQLPSSRDHLVVRIDANGIPVRTEPEMDWELLSDSLWRDCLTRQGVIAEMIELFKPELVLQEINSPAEQLEIIKYWNDQGNPLKITAASYFPAVSSDGERGWAVFSGYGIQKGYLEGITIHDFCATVYVLKGLEWRDSGYPALQSMIPVSENE